MTKTIKMGIGFATGRKSFQRVLKTYVYNWKECGLTEKDNISLNLLVAYDLRYSNTKRKDYTNVHMDILDLIDDTYFIGMSSIENEINHLTEKDVITQQEAKLFFSNGYAGKRNAVLYTALKNHIDYLLFLDDDEYPLAVTNTRSTAIWGGQHVLSSHIRNIQNADITNGHHCGYISPIPQIAFNDSLSETDFRTFIESISNDIINWESIKSVITNGGVTYADTNVLTKNTVEEVPEIKRTKFISGANLCINLKHTDQLFPFYNPPGARGEDTFLSTCLTQSKVLRIPCYTFHDGFSTYNHLMDGVLPIKLKPIQADNEQIINRFYRACIGWIRYKPLLLYITQREHYEDKITEMRQNLSETLPKICDYFNNPNFNQIQKELNRYDKNVKKHYEQYLQIQEIWLKIKDYLISN